MDSNVLSKLEELKGEYATPKELSEILSISQRTLSRWHTRGEGPPRIKKFNLILYKLTSVNEWLDNFEQQPVR